jgi:hypothetical protein
MFHWLRRKLCTLFRTKLLFEILVPNIWNDGRTISLDHHHEWDRKVRDICGGLTIFKKTKGYWVNPNDHAVFREEMIPVRVACTYTELDTILKLTLEHYADQKAVFAYLVSDEVIVVSRT